MNMSTLPPTLKLRRIFFEALAKEKKLPASPRLRRTGRCTGKILTYFSFALLLFSINHAFCFKVDGTYNPYEKELKELKEKNITIEMETDNWSYNSKRQHRKIDSIKEKLYPEDKPISEDKSKILENLFYLNKEDAPEIFKQIDKLSKKLGVDIADIYIDFDSTSTELVNFQFRDRLTFHGYDYSYDIFLTKKCFEGFTKEEFDISLARAFSKIKNFVSLQSIAISASVVTCVSFEAGFLTLLLSMDIGIDNPKMVSKQSEKFLF